LEKQLLSIILRLYQGRDIWLVYALEKEKTKRAGIL